MLITGFLVCYTVDCLWSDVSILIAATMTTYNHWMYAKDCTARIQISIGGRRDQDTLIEQSSNRTFSRGSAIQFAIQLYKG